MSKLTLGDVIAKANNPQRHTPVDFGDPKLMSNQQLEDHHTELAAQVVNIGRQLADDMEMQCGRGDGWRKRALGARRAHEAQIDKLVAEGRKRGLAFAGEIQPMPTVARGLNGTPLPSADRFQAIEARRQARERQAAIEAANAERKAANAERKAENQRIEAEKLAARLEIARINAEKQAQINKAAQHRARLKHDAAYRRAQVFIDAAVEILGKDACREVWARAREIYPDPALWADE